MEKIGYFRYLFFFLEKSYESGGNLRNTLKRDHRPNTSQINLAPQGQIQNNNNSISEISYDDDED